MRPSRDASEPDRRHGADASLDRRHAADAVPERRHGADTLKVWRGTIVGSYGDDVFVELGPRMQGVISRRQLGAEPVIGESHEFTLRGQEDGLWVLSLREQRSLTSWERMEKGSLVQARVIRKGPGGLELKIGPLHAFLPKSHTGLARDEDPKQLVGRNVTCEVIEVDRERQRVVVSRKVVLQRERASQRQREVDALCEGEVVQGRVSRIEPYGAFVRFGRGLEGLVHLTDLAHERVRHPEDVVEVGQTIDVRVLSIRKGGKRISLGLKQMTTSPWTALERTSFPGQLVEGEVTRVLGYGAFVAIRPGVEGLLHRSQTGLARDRGMASLVRVGERISVRILELDCEAERLALSLLHPSGARIAPDEAASARSFEDLVRTGALGGVAFKVGERLRSALGG